MSKKSLQKDGARYYRQTDFWRFMGAGMMIVGVIWFYFGFSAASYYVPCVITPLGLILFLIFSGRHISENDMDEERAHRLTGYDTVITERGDFSRLVLRQPADVECEAYHMGERASFFKRGKNSTPVSDKFYKTHIFFTKDALLIVSRELTLSIGRDEDGAVLDTELLLPYDTLLFAEIQKQVSPVTWTNTKKTSNISWCELVIMGQSGEVLRVPVKDDMDTSTLCDELNRKLKSTR